MEISITRTSTPKSRPPVDQLGFGRHFSDHMFVARYSQAKGGWYSSGVVPYAPFSIDPCASVLHYGQALFEGMKAFRQKENQIAVLRPHFNWQRMADGADRLCMVAPPEDLFMQGLSALLRVDQDWIPTEPGTAMYIRPTLIATEAFLGVRPSTEYIFYIVLSPVGNYYGSTSQAVRIWVEKEYTRAAPGGLGATKAGANYAGSLKAALQAREKGFAQVLWLDVDKINIEEVGTMNVFFVVNGKVITPKLTGTILDGGTRAMAIDLLKSSGQVVEERLISLTELQDAHKAGTFTEAFGTGTAAVITPIRDLTSGDFQMNFDSANTAGMGPVAAKLYEQITSLQTGKTSDSHQWLYIVPNK